MRGGYRLGSKYVLFCICLLGAGILLLSSLLLSGEVFRPASARDTIKRIPQPAPLLDGSFLLPGDLTPQQLPSALNEMDTLHMNTVIVNQTRTKAASCSSNTYTWDLNMPGNLEAILERAAALHMQVYIGLTNSMAACSMFQNDPNLSQDIADYDYVAATIQQLYGRAAAFKGWYIPNEVPLAWEQDTPSLHAFSAYYTAIVSIIRRYSSKPILVSPYLSGVYNYEGTVVAPQQVAAKALDFLNSTGVTIEVWQDSVGADAISVGYDHEPYTVQDYFSAIAHTVGSEHFWSITELFNCCIAQNAGGGYEPAAISRIYRQLLMTSGAGKRLAWIQQLYMGTVDPYHLPEAQRLLDTYKARFGLAGEYVTPLTYLWITKPSQAYPDTGNKMFDGYTADPTNIHDHGWVGISGSGEASLWIDLGKTKKVNWVAFHGLNNSSSGILLPDLLSLGCSNDNIHWTTLYNAVNTAPHKDGDYVLSNLSRLYAPCRYITATLTGTEWIFVSEIEIIAGIQPAPEA